MTRKKKQREQRGSRRKLHFERPYGVKLEDLLDFYMRIIGEMDAELDMKIDNISISGGYGYVGSENDTWAENDAHCVYFGQLVYKVESNFSIAPTFAYIDHMKTSIPIRHVGSITNNRYCIA